jgi:hypothetical protein
MSNPPHDDDIQPLIPPTNADMNQQTNVQISSENPYSQVILDLISRNATQIQSPNKQKLLDLLTNILVVEVLYCFYLDYNILLLGLRGLQLV